MIEESGWMELSNSLDRAVRRPAAPEGLEDRALEDARARALVRVSPA
jgi:hypothetical protein